MRLLGRLLVDELQVRKVQMVEKLRGAVAAALRRKRMYGLRRTAEEYTVGQTFSEVVKVRACWLGLG